MYGRWTPEGGHRRASVTRAAEGVGPGRIIITRMGDQASMAVRILCLTVLLVLAPLTRAEGLIGLGIVHNVNGLNLEWTFEHSSVYVIPGFYFDSTGRADDLAWVTGFRHRLEGGAMSEDGFYNGIIAGHLDGTRGTDRLGAGGELGYQWVADHTRWTLSAGLAALEERERFDKGVEPQAFFGFSVSLR